MAQNSQHSDWECDSSLMAATKNAMYLHCLPADISGVSCERGEVTADVFGKSRTSLYKQASFKPYVIAAMIFLAKAKDPAGALRLLSARGRRRILD